MELLIVSALVVALLVVFDLLATTFGTDSRGSFADDRDRRAA